MMAEPTSVTEANPLRQALAADPGARAVRGRPLRRDRRPGAPQARAGAVSPGAGGQPALASSPSSASPAATGPTTSSAASSRRRLAKSGGADFDELWPAVRQPRSSSRRGRSTTRQRYAKLKEKLEELDRTHGTRGNRLYYLAVAPEFFATIIDQLGKAGLIYPRHQETPLEPGGHREAVRPRPRQRPAP